MKNTDQQALRAAVRSTLAARKSLNVGTLATALGLEHVAVGRQLGAWHTSGDVRHCSRDGGFNGHACTRCFGEVFPR